MLQLTGKEGQMLGCQKELPEEAGSGKQVEGEGRGEAERKEREGRRSEGERR